MKCNTRTCTISDLPEIIKIIKSKKTMYGVNLIETGIQEIVLKEISNYFANPDTSHKIIGVFNKDELVSFGVMYFFKTSPKWFFKIWYSKFYPLDRFNIDSQKYYLVTGMIKIAESMNLNGWFCIERYSKIWTRSKSAVLETFPNYAMAEYEILEPLMESKYPWVKYIMGPMSGKQLKTLVVEEFLQNQTKINLRLHRQLKNSKDYI